MRASIRVLPVSHWIRSMPSSRCDSSRSWNRSTARLRSATDVAAHRTWAARAVSKAMSTSATVENGISASGWPSKGATDRMPNGARVDHGDRQQGLDEVPVESRAGGAGLDAHAVQATAPCHAHDRGGPGTHVERAASGARRSSAPSRVGGCSAADVACSGRAGARE